MRFILTRVSRNSKTGPIPVSTTTSDTCPDACPFKASGICYAKHGGIAMHWGNLDRSGGLTLDEFTAAIRRLPRRQLWRHNQAGDLPGIGDCLDVEALAAIVDANKGRSGFTYTHKPLTSEVERQAVAAANAAGFSVNLSADDVHEADQLADLQIGPVVCVLPSTVEGNVRLQTPAGRRIVVCPATYNDDVTCSTCGACAIPTRKSIIGFPAHGAKKRSYDRLLTQVTEDQP